MTILIKFTCRDDTMQFLHYAFHNRYSSNGLVLPVDRVEV